MLPLSPVSLFCNSDRGSVKGKLLQFWRSNRVRRHRLQPSAPTPLAPLSIGGGPDPMARKNYLSVDTSSDLSHSIVPGRFQDLAGNLSGPEFFTLHPQGSARTVI